jgi:hypothetical protein
MPFLWKFVGKRVPLRKLHKECWNFVHAYLKNCGDFIKKKAVESEVAIEHYSKVKEFNKSTKKNLFLIMR